MSSISDEAIKAGQKYRSELYAHAAEVSSHAAMVEFDRREYYLIARVLIPETNLLIEALRSELKSMGTKLDTLKDLCESKVVGEGHAVSEPTYRTVPASETATVAKNQTTSSQESHEPAPASPKSLSKTKQRPSAKRKGRGKGRKKA